MANWPQSMQAAILSEQLRPLVVDQVDLPDSLFFGQVLVRVCYTSICGSQIGEIDGIKGNDKYLPHLLGHEGSGIVIDTGEGVKIVKPGDHVVMHWKEGDGLQADPPVYCWNGRPLNAGWVTTFNEYAVVSENRLTPIPANFDLKIAPLLGCAVTTGFGIINNNAKLKIGQSIVVFGAGGVGLNVIQAASLVSAYPIIAIDLYDNKLALARKCGATHTINSSASDPSHTVFEIAGSKGADVIVENTGNPEIIELACRLTHPCGRTVLVGVPPADSRACLSTLALHFKKVLTGSHGGEAQPAIDIPRYIRLHDVGRFTFKELITDCFTLSEINTALSRMQSGKIAGRCLIDMSN